MTFKTKIFNQIYEQLYLQGVNPEEEKELSKIMLYFIHNTTLDKNTLLTCIENEDYYKLKIKTPIKKLSEEKKEELIEKHISFICKSCRTVIST